MKKHATIKDVSKLAQVSTATVSRTLNNPDSVKEETRKRVHAAIELLSYHSNALAADLKSGSSDVIGYVVPDMHIRFYNEIFQEIDCELNNCGYNLIVATHNNNPEREMKVVNKLLERKVAALVVATSLDYASFYEQIDKNDCPVILIDRKIESINLRSVSENGEECSYELMQHLLEYRHKRILILSCLSHLTIMRERVAGCRRAVEAKCAGNLQIDYLECSINLNDTRKKIKEYFQGFDQEKKPTAIVSLNPRVTEATLLALRDLAVRVPEDVSLVSFGSLNSELIQPDVTCVVQNTALIGKKTIELLNTCLGNDEDDGIRASLVVNDEIHFGNSAKSLSSDSKHGQ